MERRQMQDKDTDEGDDMERYTIDRFEEDIAVCEREDGAMVDIPCEALPDDAAEGDVLVFDGGTYTLDHDETDERRERIEDKVNALFRD